VNATHALDHDEIQTTRGEKFLALVLGVFLLVGLSWGYTKLDTRDPYAEPPPLSASDQAAVDALTQAEAQLSDAVGAESFALSDLELRRERYRTALDAGRTAPGLAAAYRQAESRLARAQARVAAARARVAALTPAANAANERRFEAVETERRNDERLTFLLRLLFSLGVLGAAYGLLHLLRGSRYFTLGLAGVGAGAVLTLVFAGDYVEDRVTWEDTGPVVLSLAGIALTLATFWGLQRYLRRRLPLRRVRKGECPFCGFPAAGNTSCEGCGRQVAGSCSHCGERRRVGVQFCGGCGEATSARGRRARRPPRSLDARPRRAGTGSPGALVPADGARLRRVGRVRVAGFVA
jgi:hypothetical protein